MAMYKIVERILNLLTKNILKIMPIAAKTHTTENIIQPSLPLNVISAKGV